VTVASEPAIDPPSFRREFVNETDRLAGVTVSCPGRTETDKVWPTEPPVEPVFPLAPITDALPPLSVLGVVPPPPAPPVVEVVVVAPPGPDGSPFASVHVTELLVGPPDEDSAPRAIAPPRNKIGAVMPTAAIAPARARRDFFPSPMPFPRQLGTLA
jgi:hypothetical protein